MTTFLGYSSTWLAEHNAIHTAKEISHQPALWRALAENLQQQAQSIEAFLPRY